VYAKQKLSPPRPRGWFFLHLLLVIFLFASPGFSRSDSLEDAAARVLARKVGAVPQRGHRFFLTWQNHSSLAEDHSQQLRESFTEEFGVENFAEKQESGVSVLRVSIEETPAFYILIANVPAAGGEITRMARFARATLTSSGVSGSRFRLSKELIWQQQEPILDAVEIGEDSSNRGLLLVLNRDNLSLYHRENDGWELQDSKRIPISEKASRAPRGEIRLSAETGKPDSIVLPGQSCEVTIAEKIQLNCHAASQTWSQGMFLGSPCDRGECMLRGDSGDWSAPERVLLYNPSSAKSAPAVAELGLPGPALSLSQGRHLQSGTATVFNLTSGNYEVYRITLACGN
jgi:hypothetical protein